MLVQFKEYIAQHKLVEKSETVLLGVSGGVDSTVMLTLFKTAKIDFAIAHCNFQLRGKKAVDDELFVKDLAQKNNVPFHSIKFETQKLADERGVSIQMAARALRFDWFNELCKKHNYSKIAIASNLDDSIETCLINLTKGTGLKGLHGILPQQGNVIHPLLFATKKEIIAFAEINDVAFRQDQSNNETKYSRNKIRHLVIPVLEEVNPSLENTFNGFFKRIKAYENIVSDYIEQFKKNAVSYHNDVMEIELDKMLALKERETILFELIYPFGFNGDQIRQLIESVGNQSGKKFYSSSHQLITSAGKIILSPIRIETLFFDVLINDTTSTINLPIKLSFRKENPNIDTNPKTACLDYDLLSFPLIIRKWKTGDKFRPIGMKGNKKLSDFFTDNKLSIFEKENIFVVTSNEKIVWVVGYRIDDFYKVTENTKRQFTINLLD